MTTETGDPWLMTPGPLTTSLSVKQAMLHDWGSRDVRFIEMCRAIRERLVEIAGGAGTHVCVCMQGSGTFAIEAVIGTLVPPDGKLLVLVNGAYGHRMAKILDYAGRSYEIHETPEDTPPDLDALDAALKADATMARVMEELTSTENRVAFARQAYNDFVMRYNAVRERIPHVIFAYLFGFGPARLLQLETPEARQAPRVSF